MLKVELVVNYKATWQEQKWQDRWKNHTTERWTYKLIPDLSE